MAARMSRALAFSPLAMATGAAETAVADAGMRSGSRDSAARSCGRAAAVVFLAVPVVPARQRAGWIGTESNSVGWRRDAFSRATWDGGGTALPRRGTASRCSSCGDAEGKRSSSSLSAISIASRGSGSGRCPASSGTGGPSRPRGWSSVPWRKSPASSAACVPSAAARASVAVVAGVRRMIVLYCMVVSFGLRGCVVLRLRHVAWVGWE